MDLMLWILVFVVSIAVLIKASDYFTESAEKIGLAFGFPPFIVGVTIVAIGTSLPELISSIIAVLSGSSEIVIGNVVGSNIANIFLVLGVAAVMAKKMKISFELIHVDLPILISSVALLAFFAWDGVINMYEGIVCLLGLIVYLVYTVSLRDKPKHKKKDSKIKEYVKKDLKRFKVSFKVWAILIGSSVFIYLGAKYTIESVIGISGVLGIGAEIVALTAVALGTSLPELTVTIMAARKGKAEMAIGNVLGSNIFNALAVIGIPSLIGVLVVPASILTFSLPVMLFATFLYFIMTQDRELTRWEGWFLLLFYVIFIFKVLNLF